MFFPSDPPFLTTNPTNPPQSRARAEEKFLHHLQLATAKLSDSVTQWATFS
jgi:hypothetical protein